MAVPLERSYSLSDAEAALTGEFGRLGLRFEIEVAGELIQAARCTIFDEKHNSVLASGNGKGELMASRVGSLFEAAEHLFSNYHLIDPERLFYLDSFEFTRGNPMCDALPLVLLRSADGTEIPFLKHEELGGARSTFYPLALACPEYIDLQLAGGALRQEDRFNYGRIEQYSTNSGTAIGMTAEEAIVHGLLEGIERTSLSMFLADVFIMNREKSLRVVSPLTLPTTAKDVAYRLEKEIGSQVTIFEMPNKFGVPAFVSWMDQHAFRIGIAGYGCSLSTEHAILRCLYELAQYHNLTKHIFGVEWLKSKARAIQTELEGLPLHRDCAIFDMGWKCRTLGFDLVDYEQLPKQPFAHEPGDYLTQLTDLIHGAGEVPYASEIKTLDNGISVYHTFITGEDRFFNVTNCKSTFPANLRGFFAT